MKHVFYRVVGLAALVVCAALPAGAQSPRSGGAPVETGVGPAELQRMFDAYALMQAQDQLRLSDDQYAPFLARFKALLDARRKAVVERGRLVQALRQLVNDPQSDENQIRDQLKALQDLDARAVADVRKAHDAVDQVLDLRQQARFRVFEENMERRKLELVARARQANRLRKQQQ